MTTLYQTDAAGNPTPVEVPEELVAQYLRTGQYQMPAGELVVRSKATDEAAIIPPENLATALEKGWRLETTEESAERAATDRFGETGGKVLAATSAAASGATFGLSNLVATEFGGIDPKTLQMVRDAYPDITTAGEVVGGVAGAFLPGGALKGAAKLLPAKGVSNLGIGAAKVTEKAILKGVTTPSLGRRVLAKTLGMGAGGGAEGALWGVGQTITEATLGDPDSVAETLAWNVIENAGLGAAAGGVFGAIGGIGAHRAAARTAQKTLRTVAEEAEPLARAFSRDRALEALGLNAKSVVGKLGAKADDAWLLLTEKGIHPDGGSILEKGLSRKKLLERLGDVNKHYGEQTTAIVDGLDTLMQQGNLRQYAPSWAAIEQRLLKKMNEYPENDRLVAAAREQLEASVNHYKKLAKTEGDFRTLQNDLRYVAKKAFPKRITPEFGDAHWGARDAWSIIKDDLNTYAARLLDAAGPNAGNMHQQLLQANAVFSTTNKLSKLTKNKEFQNTIFDAFRQAGSAAARSAAYAAMWGIGTARIAQRAVLGGGISLGTKASGNFGVGMAQLGHQKATLGKVADTAMWTEKKIGQAISRFDKSLNKGLIRKSIVPASHGILRNLTDEKDRRKGARKYAIKLAKLQADPEQFANNIAVTLGGLEDSAPGIAARTASIMANVAQFLYEKMPSPPATTDLQPLIDEWMPSGPEASRFERYVAAAMFPFTFLDDLANGILTREAVEAWAALYPRALEATQLAVQENVAKMKKRMSYNNQAQLGTLLQIATAPSLTPDSIRRAQDVFAQQPQSGHGPGGIRLTGLENLKLSEGFQTQTQRNEKV